MVRDISETVSRMIWPSNLIPLEDRNILTMLATLLSLLAEIACDPRFNKLYCSSYCTWIIFCARKFSSLLHSRIEERDSIIFSFLLSIAIMIMRISIPSHTWRRLNIAALYRFVCRIMSSQEGSYLHMLLKVLVLQHIRICYFLPFLSYMEEQE